MARLDVCILSRRLLSLFAVYVWNGIGRAWVLTGWTGHDECTSLVYLHTGEWS